MQVVSGKVIASCFALSAFAVAIIAGLASANSAAQILLDAFVAMIICYVVGLIVGLICERVITAHLSANERANPAIDSEQELKPQPALSAPSTHGGAKIADAVQAEEPIEV